MRTKSESVRETFKNESIFITGGSGFIGKVLIEHLLRCCYDLKCIYVLMRGKKELNLKQRLEKMLEEPLFDRLKMEKPENVSKIIPISGDMMQLNLGISDEDMSTLKDNVSIVINGAATVRFDQPLHEAILINTRSIRELINMMKQFKNLKAFLHLSTTYAFCDKSVIEEKIYAPRTDWKKFIQLAENYDAHLLNILTTKCIDPLPNTYTFSKSLGEDVVVDLCSGTIPTIILRPSIVSNSLASPFTGWVDNFNGSMAIFVVGAKGITHTVYGDFDIQPDHIPVDMVVKAIILAIWQKTLYSDPIQKYEVDICNCSPTGYKKMSWRDAFNSLKDGGVPAKAVWRPAMDSMRNYYFYYVAVMLGDVLPAMLFDVLLRIKGNRPRLMKIQRKLFAANAALAHFLFHQFSIPNEYMRKLETMLKLPEDVEDFGFKANDFDADQPKIMYEMALGVKKYLLREKSSPEDIEKDKTHLKRLEIIGQIFDMIFYMCVAWLIFKLNVIQFVFFLVKRLLFPFLDKCV